VHVVGGAHSKRINIFYLNLILTDYTLNFILDRSLDILDILDENLGYFRYLRRTLDILDI